MRVPVGEQDQIILVDRQVVNIGNLALSPRPDELAGRIEDEDRCIGAPVPDMDETLGIDDEIADEAQWFVSGRLAPAPLHPVPAIPQRNDEMFFGHVLLPQ